MDHVQQAIIAQKLQAVQYHALQEHLTPYWENH